MNARPADVGRRGGSGSGGAGTTSSATSGTGWKQKEYSFVVDETKLPRTIDLIVNQKPLGRGIYEFTAPATMCVSCHKPPNEPLDWKIPGFKPEENQRAYAAIREFLGKLGLGPGQSN